MPAYNVTMKDFAVKATVICCIKIFIVRLGKFRAQLKKTFYVRNLRICYNKLECLYLASFFSLF
jgi:hypothetical protein